MEIKQLKYFIACAKHRSFTKAAQELHTSQPHVSVVISSLEEELKLNLFIRLSKGIEFTEAGQKFAEAAIEVLECMEKLEKLTAELRNAEKCFSERFCKTPELTSEVFSFLSSQLTTLQEVFL